MRKPTGWVALHRKLWESDIWKSRKPFDERSAWIDLLLMAEFEDRDKAKRGQILTSYGELANRWHWGKSKVYRFLHHLENEKCIEISRSESGTANGTANGTVLTIEKYALYQDVWNGKRNEKRKHNNNINNIHAPDRVRTLPERNEEDEDIGPIFA